MIEPLIRRVYEVEILYRRGSNETDLDSASLESLAYETDQGAASGLVTLKTEETLTPGQMAKALLKQSSDPTFLLDESELVICKLCGNQVAAELAHLHQGEYVGDECCWDERLRSTE